MIEHIAKQRQGEALVRWQSQGLMQTMIQEEPIILAFMEIAASQTCGRQRWHAYSTLKHISDPFVGWRARNPLLASSRCYETFIHCIDELLPDEHADEVEQDKTFDN